MSLMNEEKELTARINQLPEGSLNIKKREGKKGTVLRCAHYIDGKQLSLGGKDNELISKLAYKRYLSEKRKEIRKEIIVLRRFLKLCSKEKSSSEKLLEDNGFYELIRPVLREDESKLSEWEKAKYKDNSDYHPERLKFKTKAGYKVRSKSEQYIGNALFDEGLYIRYEAALQLSGSVVFPDFTIRSSKNPGCIIIWEHFGMMDNERYRNRAKQKMGMYYDNGYLPGINMITTFEDKENPPDKDLVDSIIKYFF